ncbi:MAG: hypothetical protein M1838_001855 [Thelocarpon superellum]|nr:MAG: hypothetical protein M1838_001855 [Thelocarpon superellum]
MSDSSPLDAGPSRSDEPQNPYEPRTDSSQPEPRHHDLTQKIIGSHHFPDASATPSKSSPGARRRPSRTAPVLADQSSTAQVHNGLEHKRHQGASTPRVGAMPRPVGGSEKLGTFSGVFVPTSLNVLSILMFLRFGFILGQSGVVGMMSMLVVSYLINLVTTLSISAIATNGTVRGGGAYYLISRSLGPEFGGSIGVVFYLGFVFNTGMNAVGLIDCLNQNFGSESGSWYQLLQEGFWWQYLWATIVLVICTAICLAGSGIFARASNGLLAVVLIATFSIPFSALVRKPFESRQLGVEFTGLSTETFRENLMPRLTKGAAGSQVKGRESFQDLFGILFPATGGIFAGASMSGDLKYPSKAIPKGTLAGLALTFVAYTIVIFAMAATITRPSFYRDVNVIQDTNVSEALILLGEFATTFFSALMGVIGSAKLLQALARDNLLPGFALFGQGTAKNDEPTYAIIITYVVAQITMLLDINQIASFVTMTYLMTFLVTNLACFLLKIGSAPNFRPSFRYFNWQTAALGTVISGATMFFVDGLYATGCVGILIVVFVLIHYTSPPKSWGDVSQGLIYHQVRKYLLRLRQEHVKFWRPQILLLINDPRRQYKLIQFCNSMKKGALYILGHVIVSPDFGDAVPEARRQQLAWTRYIDVSKVKAFVNIAISPVFEWGTRNIVLSSGLGGMRPNIAVIGFFNMDEGRQAEPLIDLSEPATAQPSPANGIRRRTLSGREEDRVQGLLPTDECRSEVALKASSYVTVLEDLLLRLQINVAVAKGFQNLHIPHPAGKNDKKTIDLWPIQMSAEITGDGDSDTNLLTTNFDTYTLILQLGCILDTVPSWQRAYALRVAVFVEYESDVEEERGRVKTLLDNLRIQAEILVFWLASGELKTYEIIVNGVVPPDSAEAQKDVEEALKEEEWWREIQRIRGKRGESSATEHLADVEGLLGSAVWPGGSFQDGPYDSRSVRSIRSGRIEGLKRILRQPRRRASSFGLISRLGVNLGMRTHRLHPDLVHHHVSHASASEGSDSDEGIDSEVFTDDDEDEEEGGGEDGDDEDDEEERRARSPPRKPSDKAAQSPQRRNSDTVGELGPPSRSGTSQPTPSTRPKPPFPFYRQSSNAKFSSKPVPLTKVATEDGTGPSIMFEDSPAPDRSGSASTSGSPSASPSASPSRRSQAQSPHPPHDKQPHRRRSHHRSIYATSAPASGFPGPSALPLSFNDLPCRAQHLILNELLRAQSADTAVLFTTLPSPLEGTGRSEADSMRYLSDLEVLCLDLPPVLLVHSNSMTVTMNL